MAAKATQAGLAGTSAQNSNPWVNSGPGRATTMIRKMISGMPNVAHKIIKAFRVTLATSPPIDLESNLRNEPKVKMKIATER